MRPVTRNENLTAPARRGGRWLALAAGAGLAVVLAGCGGGSSPSVVRSGSTTTTKGASTTSPPTSAASTTAPPTSSPAAGQQHLTVTPSTGLSDGQSVKVDATGFSPNQPLVVTQCAALGTKTQSADCNLAGLQMVTSDATGAVHIQFTVVKGPFGAAQVTCSATQPCLISVTQASPSPTQEADTRISFG